MIRVTWAWLGQGPALDLANTVAVENGIARDLIASPDAYERWVGAEAVAEGLSDEDRTALMAARPNLMSIRTAIRSLLEAAAAGVLPPSGSVDALNAASRAAPEWLELDPGSHRVKTRHRGSSRDRILARFARSALTTSESERGEAVRVCPAPSCGMYYRPVRERQVWCSVQCGTRARVARSYRTRSSVANLNGQ